jgi:Ca-activated chloride channel family protein
MYKKKMFWTLSVNLLVLFSFFQLTAQDKEEEIIKVNTSLVSIPVIVSDRNGRNIAGLKAENFNVFQDGEQQKIEYFASEETPINVAILLDTSRSTQDVLGNIKKAGREFIKQLRPNDRAMIVTFDSEVRVLNDLTSDQRVLERAINEAEIGERVGTVLYDAVDEVVNQYFAQVKGRKAIILLTDGKDAGSNIYQEELIREIDESDTLIYSVFYETGNFQPRQNNRFPDINPFPRNNRFPNRRRFPDDFPRRRQQDERMQRRRQRVADNNEQAVDFLRTLSEATAGRLYQNNMDDLRKTFGLIADELRKQYLIGYYPEKTGQEGQVHQIKVRTDVDNAVVRAKSTYRAQKTQ